MHDLSSVKRLSAPLAKIMRKQPLKSIPGSPMLLDKHNRKVKPGKLIARVGKYSSLTTNKALDIIKACSLTNIDYFYTNSPSYLFRPQNFYKYRQHNKNGLWTCMVESQAKIDSANWYDRQMITAACISKRVKRGEVLLARSLTWIDKDSRQIYFDKIYGYNDAMATRLKIIMLDHGFKQITQNINKKDQKCTHELKTPGYLFPAMPMRDSMIYFNLDLSEVSNIPDENHFVICPDTINYYAGGRISDPTRIKGFCPQCASEQPLAGTFIQDKKILGCLFCSYMENGIVCSDKDYSSKKATKAFFKHNYNINITPNFSY